MTRLFTYCSNMEYPPPGTGKAGQWVAFNCGPDYNARLLTCGTMFKAHIHLSGGRVYVDFNGKPMNGGASLEDAMKICEKEIVRRVMEMLPAYKAILARVKGES